MKITTQLFSLLIAVFMVSGCGGMPSTPTLPVKETVSQPVLQANDICKKISFKLDPAIGSGYECQTIAESSGADLPYFGIHPEYTGVTLKNYPWTDTSITPRIDAFPVQRFGALLPDLLPGLAADLQARISGSTTSSQELPLLPPINAKQMFSSQVAVIQFKNGTGIRYLTQYSQGIVPINNQAIFYTFQGLTTDGQTWISVIMPISSASLLRDAKNPPKGQSWEDFRSKYKTYIAETATHLSAQSLESFTPAINVLDALVSSIAVQP